MYGQDTSWLLKFQTSVSFICIWYIHNRNSKKKVNCSLLTENKSKCLVNESLINKLLSVACWFALLLIHLFFCRKQRALQIWRLKLLRALQVLRCVCTRFWITNRKEVTTTSIETVVGVKIWDMLNESCSHKIFQNCQKIYLIP